AAGRGARQDAARPRRARPRLPAGARQHRCVVRPGRLGMDPGPGSSRADRPGGPDASPALHRRPQPCARRDPVLHWQAHQHRRNRRGAPVSQPADQSFDPRAGVAPDGTMQPKNYDALLLASFGGPEGQDDVIPFLRNVTSGRGIPDERLEEVATHYRANGGISPINAQNRALKSALEAELARRGINLPVLWGNRNWDPYITDVFKEAYDAGHRRVLAVSTSAYSGYSSCRQYREDFGMALVETGLAGKLEVDKVRQYFDHPGFVEPFVDGLAEGLNRVRADLAAQGAADAPVHILFATHSIPIGDAENAGPRGVEFEGGSAYVAQHLATARAVLDRVPEAAGVDWSLVYQSRSGAPHVPWLEPDI